MILKKISNLSLSSLNLTMPEPRILYGVTPAMY